MAGFGCPPRDSARGTALGPLCWKHGAHISRLCWFSDFGPAARTALKDETSSIQLFRHLVTLAPWCLGKSRGMVAMKEESHAQDQAKHSSLFHALCHLVAAAPAEHRNNLRGLQSVCVDLVRFIALLCRASSGRRVDSLRRRRQCLGLPAVCPLETKKRIPRPETVHRLLGNRPPAPRASGS